MKIIDKNKKVFFEYEIDEKFEAGIVLVGSEVKSIRLGNVRIADSFCFFEKGELWLKNCHITPYEKGSYFNEDAKRSRKLLLNKRELDKLVGKIKTKGLTLVPTMIYFNKNRVKVEIVLAKGKKLHDKRQSIKEKDLKREADRAVKEYR
ncbi:MAG: SsrA-binding protein SmpB [Firmicutes bacterium]|nr:SsrA-binding protein SmpB [Bacillota bacterium]